MTERFIRTLKNKIYKRMTTASKNVCFDVLGDITDEYKNTFHRTIKLNTIDVKFDSYVDHEDSNEKDPKFKIGDLGKVSKYKNIFAKGYAPNWSEEIFVISKTKNTVAWTYVVSDLNGEETVETLYEKESQKTNQKEFRTVKVIKGKENKLYVKWEGYDNLFNSWIDKSDLI